MSPWSCILRILRVLPQGALSRGWGWVAERRLPSVIQARVNRAFARSFGVDVVEAEHPPEAYRSLSEFFVRRLRPGARTWPDDVTMPGSPVDGLLGSFGVLEAGKALQAKGVSYRVSDLLGEPADEATFRSGLYFTIYLSPRHYHRIHAPVSAHLRGACAVPGRLLPVNPAAVRSVSDLFARNERLVTRFSGPMEWALVAIGAYNVGRISAGFDPTWNGERGAVTNRRGQSQPETRTYDPPLQIPRGVELMAFHLGSTVVLLLDGDPAALPPPAPDLVEGMELRVGRPLLAAPLGAG